MATEGRVSKGGPAGGEAVGDIVGDGGREVFIDTAPDLSWFARRLSDAVPNPWQAARIARSLLERLRQAGETDASIHGRRSWLIHELRKHVGEGVETLARAVFMEKLARQEIRFDLEAGQPGFEMAGRYEIPAPDEAGLMTGNDRRPLQLSLFEPVYTHQFDSGLERRFARYLDERKALRWWHRVAARQGGDYYLKGWRRNRIWPDFVAVGGDRKGLEHLPVFETKGAHLDSDDAGYKKRVPDALEGAFDRGSMTVRDGPAKGVFRLVFDEAEFPAALAGLD